MISSEDSSHSRSRPTNDVDQQPNLETLVAYLVAAKRSLSSINHVWRANEIVTAARIALEEIVVLSARTGFLQRELENQLRDLHRIKDEIEQLAQLGRREFSNTVEQLDNADNALQPVLISLRDTPVEPNFFPSGAESKSLHDFIDENAMQEVQRSLKESIDSTHSAQAEFDASNAAFHEDLSVIQRQLKKQKPSSKSQPSSAVSPLQPVSFIDLPEIIQSLEFHAHQMAHSLESLVHHFDLCATAVKHTEGGGAEALRVAGDIPSEMTAGIHLDNQLGDPKNASVSMEPLTEDEYQEMVSVLVKDAKEAEIVVREIQESIAEMENFLERIMAEKERSTQSCSAMVESVHQLETFSKYKLSTYITQSQVFARIWKEQYQNMQAGMGDLTELRTMYVGFLDAYDDLILEVARRKAVRLTTEKIIRETETKLRKVYEEDLRARKAFRAEHGTYLPITVWPGLDRDPMKVEVKRIFSGIEQNAPEQTNANDVEAGSRKESSQEADSSAPEEKNQQQPETKANNVIRDSIPDLPKSVIEKVLSRRKARVKAQRLQNAPKQSAATPGKAGVS